MKWVFLVFVILYGVALFFLMAGTFGWFGQETDPLSGIFLLPLGLPWNLLADRIGVSGVAVGVGAPIINAVVLLWLWKR